MATPKELSRLGEVSKEPNRVDGEVNRVGEDNKELSKADGEDSNKAGGVGNSRVDGEAKVPGDLRS